MAKRPPSPHSQLWRWEVEKWLKSDFIASDTPPTNPRDNTLWFDTIGGGLYVWYVDPDSAQWVQISQPMGDFVYRGGDVMTGPLTLPGAPIAALHAATKAYVDAKLATLPPNDDNEYSMVNGVWRLKSQTFDLAGKNFQDVTVPAWGPTQARITGFNWNSLNFQSGIRVSGDGVTFDAGSIYSMSGYYHTSAGSGNYANYPNTNNTFFLVASNTDNVSLAQHTDFVLNLQRSGAGYITCRTKSSGGYTTSGGYVHYTFDGWVMPTTGGITSPLKAFRFLQNGAGNMTSGKMVVEWLA